MKTIREKKMDYFPQTITILELNKAGSQENYLRTKTEAILCSTVASATAKHLMAVFLFKSNFPGKLYQNYFQFLETKANCTGDWD